MPQHIRTIKQTPETPHRIAAPGNDHYTSHAGYIDWLYECAVLWEQRGVSEESNRIRKLILKHKSRGARRCPVCIAAEAKFACLARP